jgi:hypothetical protein
VKKTSFCSLKFAKKKIILKFEEIMLKEGIIVIIADFVEQSGVL